MKVNYGKSKSYSHSPPSKNVKSQQSSSAALEIPTMATTSSSNGSSSSPISKIAQDHLYSILLLLPLDSIFCFAMTCKKFKSLTYSDSFWESLCRRDWTQCSVDSLRSFVAADTKQEFTWKKLYQQIYQLDSVYCSRLLTYPQEGQQDLLVPQPRASHSLNFVSGCLVLFGGGCEGGRHLDDTWVAYVGNDFKRILKWNKIESGIPSGRFGHSCVVIGDCLVLFGGINDRGARQNDTWLGQVALRDDAFGITLSWRLLDVGSIAPPPRGAHAACSIDKRRMLIHGGIGLSGLRLGDTWVLDLPENLHLGIWQEIVTHPSPPSRSGHTLTHVGGNQTVLFGGRGLGYEVLNDLWLFGTSEGYSRWVQLLFDLQNIPQGLALPRVGHSANLILGGRLLIYGGEDSYRHRKNDFWVLDISLVTSMNMQSGQTSNSERSKTKLWRRLKSKGDNQSGRSFHRACVDHSGCNLYIFGGMIDGLLQPAESSGLRFDGELFLVELVLQC